jgi:tRNA pseudouridine38-40 synthase
MAKYALLLEYNGSEFHGWQIQTNTRTVQGTLEYALAKFANEPIQTITAGRTDTGVHALNQIVHFSSNANRDLYGWVKGVNANLPASIRIKQVTLVSDEFDARFSALSRTYHYYLLTQSFSSSLLCFSFS